MELALTDANGLHIGTASGDRVGFSGATPVALPIASANQAAVATTAPTNSSPYGFSTSAQAAALITLVNELRSDLVQAGIIKGSA